MDSSLIRESSAWSADQIQIYLRDTEIPIRLACLNGRGVPLICSLWYLFNGRTIQCSTQVNAKIVALLENDPRCGFEVAGDLMPYCGVRGQGFVSLSAKQGPDVLEKLIKRYLHSNSGEFANWLRSRSKSEVAITIKPQWVTSWDFTRRMVARS